MAIKFKAKISKVYGQQETGESILIISPDRVDTDIDELKKEIEKIGDDEATVEIKKTKNLRSLDANAYCWVLCSRIAEAIGATKNEVYRKQIRDVGVYVDIPNLTHESAVELANGWRNNGIGWIAEKVDISQDRETETVRFYKGSSQYDTAQMSRLIDNIIFDCKAMDIPTETPDEIANIKSLWATEYDRIHGKENDK